MSIADTQLLRTIRFDASDEAVYDVAAAPGEWAVPGGFAFADLQAADVKGKTRQAFANGFLGTTSFGRSTFVTIAQATAEDRAALVYRLALHFVERYGAPDTEAAMPVAEDEVAVAESLALGHAINTVLTIRRVRGEDGEITEEFRTIKPPAGEPLHTRIWTVENDEA